MDLVTTQIAFRMMKSMIKYGWENWPTINSSRKRWWNYPYWQDQSKCFAGFLNAKHIFWGSPQPWCWSTNVWLRNSLVGPKYDPKWTACSRFQVVQLPPWFEYNQSLALCRIASKDYSPPITTMLRRKKNVSHPKQIRKTKNKPCKFKKLNN